MAETRTREASAELRQVVVDAQQLLKDPKPARDETESILLSLLKQHDGWVLALEYAAVLAPLARNRKAWDYVCEIRGPRMRAFLGHLAYRRFLHDGPTEDEMERWFHLVEDSAQRGHIESRFLVAARKAPRNRVLRTVILASYRLYLILVTAPIIVRNPRDDRLPSKMRNAPQTMLEEQ